MRCLIVDDESLARRKVRDFLKSHRDFEIVGECVGGREAAEAILHLKPQVVFLDVRIPEMDGFRVLEKVEQQFMPEIVFVTAHDEYAVKAFEVHAFDYLLKPFTRRRFDEIVVRLRQRLGNHDRENKTRLLAWMRQSLPAGQSPDRLVVKANGRIVLLDISHIEWIEAQGDYVLIHTDRENYLTRETMQAMESQLKDHRFVRIHRSAIVNLGAVAQLQPIWSGDYKVTLRSGEWLTWSRTFRPRPQQRIGR
jgi:two-component system, LytTR family, response regulator